MPKVKQKMATLEPHIICAYEYNNSPVLGGHCQSVQVVLDIYWITDKIISCQPWVISLSGAQQNCISSGGIKGYKIKFEW